MKTKKSQKLGFTLVEIMIVVAIIGLLAAIAVPNFVKARYSAQQNACLNNLRQIDGAIQQWALDNKASSGSHVNITDVTPYLKDGNHLVCPSGGATATPDSSYATDNIDSKPVCKIAGTATQYPHAFPQ